MPAALTPPRRFLIPEAVQTSELDCGPAALYALLEGFNIPVSYGRLREACQTSVDGTSIDTLEQVAIQLGLVAEQIILPVDHLVLDQTRALPALVVVRLTTGLTHFVIAWNTVARWVQIMDPGIGRRWVERREFVDELYIHTHRVEFERWRAWVSAGGFLNPLRHRLSALRVPPEKIDQWIARAKDDSGWYTTARLDAAARMTAALVQAGGILAGDEATETITRYFDVPQAESDRLFIPSGFWSAALAPDVDPYHPTHMLVTGALIIRVLRPRALTEPLPAEVDPPPPEIVAALTEAPARPDLQVIEALRADGLLTPAILLFAVGMASLGVVVQAVLFQSMLQITALAAFPNEQFEIFVVIVLFLLVLLIVEIPISQITQRIGRRIETRLRVRFLEKLPRLSDAYFSSRLASDMVQRAHSLRQLHQLPDIALNLLRLAFQLFFTLLGVIWLEPASAPLAILATAVFLGVAYVTRPLLQELDLRVSAQSSGLARFYLDALRGLVPLKLHNAERSYRREYEGLLTEWARAGGALARVGIAWQGMSVLIYSLFAIWLVSSYLGREGASTGALLLFYWTLSLPDLATSLVQAAQQYPQQRNLVLRILEPLGAPNETTSSLTSVSEELVPAEPIENTTSPAGIALELRGVNVEASGHPILHDINLNINAGEHIAIVGPSGAGKSSLVGALLGWRTIASGDCLIDGGRLDGERLARLRRETVWVDPDVRLWNQTLWENVLYGNTPHAVASPEHALLQAELLGVIERLENGVETVLGEGGGLVSGGEGQRVRLARAMARAHVRLVILDEPFRGLDRETRRALLARARAFWRNATLLCVTHDVGETLGFERVLVLEDGRIVQDAPPQTTAADPTSRYSRMLESEEQVRQGLWQGAHWRNWWIQDSKLRQDG